VRSCTSPSREGTRDTNARRTAALVEVSQIWTTPLLPAIANRKLTSVSGAKVVEKIFPISGLRDTTMLGLLSWTLQSLTCLSVDPVTKKPGTVGLMSNDETEVSWACRDQTGFES